MASHNQFDSLMRQLEQELEAENSFDRLLQQEEEMESKAFTPVAPRHRPFANGNPEIRWVQKALNRVSAFGIAEDGVLSVQTRRALQKFQAEQGIRPTGKLGPRTRATLIEASGIPAPRPIARDSADAPLLEMEGPVSCPTDNPNTVSGFSRFSADTSLLPSEQQKKLADIAQQISTLASGLPPRELGAPPIRAQVLLVGHADLDTARESREPGFLQFLSERRAAAVRSDLCKRMPDSLSERLLWIDVGVGAGAPAVSPTHNEAERQCNRRVGIKISPNGEPDLNPGQFNQVDTEFHIAFPDYYEAALQGTSGKYPTPRLAEQMAREIALKIVPFLKQRAQEVSPHCAPFEGIQNSFKNALQGTASNSALSTADAIISAAYEVAQRAQFGRLEALRKIQWQNASLPQPMSPDCDIVRGKAPGPPNHVLCGTHGHVLDINTRTVIAHDLDEYKRLPRR
jgi:outer membrane protein OmpA-like peptidoglycan-associated protein